MSVSLESTRTAIGLFSSVSQTRTRGKYYVIFKDGAWRVIKRKVKKGCSGKDHGNKGVRKLGISVSRSARRPFLL